MLGRIFSVAVLVLVVAACPEESASPPALDGGGLDSAGDTGGTDGVLPDVDPGDEASLDVYTRLRPTCVPCHDSAWPRPLFSTFDAFMTLLVTAKTPADTYAYVEPGDPDGSRLIDLLDKSEGSYFMPASTAFIDLEAAGQTQITIQEIEDWITGLKVTVTVPVDDATPPTDGVLVRRLTARQLVAAAHAAIGLDESDFWGYTTSYGWYDVVKNGSLDKFPVRSPDATPDIQGNSYDFKPAAQQRWAALGGADVGNGRPSTDEISPAFLQHWLQTTQAWCRIAVTKPGNTAVLGSLTLSQDTASDEAAISDQIGALHLQILGEPATAAQTAVLLDEVFKVYESFSNTESAWTAVCSTLLRDLQFITY